MKPVRAAISSRISGKSTRGSLAATASRKAESEGGSSSLSSGLKKVLFALHGFEPNRGITRQACGDGAIGLVQLVTQGFEHRFRVRREPQGAVLQLYR